MADAPKPRKKRAAGPTELELCKRKIAALETQFIELRNRPINESQSISNPDELPSIQTPVEASINHHVHSDDPEAVSSQSSLRMSLMDIKTIIPEYEPERGNINVEEWLSTLESLRIVYGWNDLNMLFYAGSQLKGSAAKWFLLEKGQISSWGEFRSKILLAFPIVINKSAILANLMCRRKLPQETFEMYFYDVIALCRRLCLPEKEVITYVISGLNNRELSNRVEATQPVTLVETLRQIKLLESMDDHVNLRNKFLNINKFRDNSSNELKRSFYNRFDNRSSSTSKYHDNRPLFSNKNFPNKIQSNLSRSMVPTHEYRSNNSGKQSTFGKNKFNNQSQSNIITCYNCQKPGHISRHCPQKLNKINNQNIRFIDAKEKNECYRNILVEDMLFDSFIDLGSACTTIKYSCVMTNNWKLEPCETVLKVFGGKTYRALGKINKNITINNITLNVELTVVPDSFQEMSVLIGMNFLNDPRVILVKRYNSLDIELDTSYNEKDLPDKFQNNVFQQLRMESSSITLQDLNIADNVDFAAKQALLKLLNEFRDVISMNLSELGKSKNFEMNLTLNKPDIVRYKPYRVPYGQLKILDDIITELQDNDIIEPSRSEYASPVLLVPKKDGGFRMCIDYRKLNRITNHEYFPTPNIEEQLNSFTGAKIFNSLDLFSGYYQVSVEENSRKYTSFVTSTGQYQFKRMPFGLSNAPAVFMRMMSNICGKMKPDHCIVYLDDILLPSDSIEESLNKLRKFLILLREEGLTINLKKSQFFAKSISYLGHELNEEGIQPGRKHIDAIKHFSIPNNITQVKQFLGLTGYFRKFISHYSIIAKPLTSLLKNNVNFIWGPSQQESFELLIDKLCQKPVLALYDFHAKHELHTDACSFGISGMLIQIQSDNKRRVVSYFSRATTERESKYHSHELEALAIVASLDRFRFYLLNKSFTIVTDCRSLKFLQDKINLVGRVARWWLKIQEFDFKVEHRSSKHMSHVDCLSRNRNISVSSQQLFAVTVSTLDWIASLQQQDPKLKEIITILENEYPVNQFNVLSRDYVLKQNKLFKKINDNLKLVVPSGLRWKVIKSCHDDVGHFALTNTLNLLKKDYYFLRMRSLVTKYIHNCLECKFNKRGVDESRIIIHPIEKIGVPFHTIHLDHVGPFPKSKKGNIYILGIIDAFSKYTILKPLRNCGISPVIKVLDETSQYFGMPSRIISDRGSAFTSKEFKKYCFDNNIQLILTAVRTPRSNGQVERVFRTLNRAIASMTKEQSGNDWDRHIPSIQYGLNNIKHDITGCSAQKLVLTYEPSNMTFNKLTLALHDNNIVQSDYYELENFRRLVESRIKEKQNEKADKINFGKKSPTQYKVGDLILIQCDYPATGTSKKILPRYKGPYMVSKVLFNDRYQITDAPTVQLKQKPFKSVFSADRMKPWLSLKDMSELDIDSSTEDANI